MQRRTDARTVTLILVSMLIGSLAIPRIAQAVGSVVTIQGGGSTTRAGVTKANQLLGTETAASSLHAYRVSMSAPACHTLAAAPAQRGLILRQLVLTLISTGGPGNSVVLYRGPGWAPLSEWLRISGQPGSTVAVPLGDGFAVKAGDEISLQNGSLTGDVTALGYLVPSAAVPATTVVTSG